MSQYEAVTSQEVMSRDLRLLEVTSFEWKSHGSGCRRPKTRVYCTFHFLQRCSSVGGSHVTGNDITWHQVIGSDLEVMSFDRKSPGSGCRRPKSCIYCRFYFLQSYKSQWGSYM